MKKQTQSKPIASKGKNDPTSVLTKNYEDIRGYGLYKKQT
jgi:hypothetical protein